jgi:hypothetical protein
MSTSPLEVRKRRNKGLFGALAFCLMALGMVGGTAQAIDPITLISHSPAHYPSPNGQYTGATPGINVPLKNEDCAAAGLPAGCSNIVLNFNGPVESNTTDKTIHYQGNNLITTTSEGSAKIVVQPGTGLNGQPLGLHASFSNGNKTITITHDVPFDEQTLYTVQVSGLIADADDNGANQGFSSNVDGNGNPLPTPVGGSVGAVNPFIFRTLDTRAPYIVNHTPSNNTTDLANALTPNGGVIRVTFDEPMDAASVLSNTTIVAVFPDGSTQDLTPNLSLTMSTDNQILSIQEKVDPNDSSKKVLLWPSSLSAASPTRVLVTVAGTDLAGFPLTANPNGVNDSNVNPFRVPIADQTGPTLVSSDPSSGAANIPINPSRITLNFSELVDTSSGVFKTQSDLPAGSKLNATVLLLIGDINEADLLPGTFTVSPANALTKTVTITGNFPFPAGQAIHVVIPGKDTHLVNGAESPYVIRDAVGNKAPSKIADFSFGTQGGTAPTVASISPSNGTGFVGNNPGTVPPGNTPQGSNDNRVDLNSSITISFTSPVDPLTFTSELRQVDPTTTDTSKWPLVATTVTASNNNQTFTVTPVNPLVGGDKTVYRFVITSAKGIGNNFDLIPNSLAPNNTIFFVTDDKQGPQIGGPPQFPLPNPVNGANVDPATQTNVTFSFTEPVNTDQPLVVSLRYVRAQNDTSPVPPLPRLTANDLSQALSTTNTQVTYQIKGSTVNGNQVTLHFDKYMELDTAGDIVDFATDPRNSDNDNTNNISPVLDNAGNPILDQWAFAPGEQVIFQVLNAQDKFGNPIQNSSTPQPNPWSFNINDVRPPKVRAVQVGPVPVTVENQTAIADDPNTANINESLQLQRSYPFVALNDPVVITFSKPMSTQDADRLTFQADGNWCTSADVLSGGVFVNCPDTQGNTAVVGGFDFSPGHINTWRAKISGNSAVYSADLRQITLTHVAFPEKSNLDPNVTERCSPGFTDCSDLSTHTFKILDAKDEQIPGSTQFSIIDPSTGNVRSNIPQQSNFSFVTSSVPRVSNVEFQVALPDGWDLTAHSAADNAAAEQTAEPDIHGLLGGTRAWKSFGEIGYRGTQAVVALNSALRFTFSGNMNQATVPPPQFTKGAPILSWHASWNAASTQVTWTHDDLFAGPNQPYALNATVPNGNGGTDPAYGPNDVIYDNLTQGTGVDIIGDNLFTQDANPNGIGVPLTRMSTIDVQTPTMQIQYLANVNNTTDASKILCVNGSQQSYDGSKAVWKDLAGATNVPVNTVIRVRLNETFGPGSVQSAKSIALAIQPQGGGNPAGANGAGSGDSDAGRLAAALKLGLRNVTNGPDDNSGTYLYSTPSAGQFLAGESPLSASGNARQDYTVGNTTYNGGQTYLKLNLVSPSNGNADNDQSRGSYSLRFVAGDTRLDDDGLPADTPGRGLDPTQPITTQLLGSLNRGVPGNQIAQDVNFTVEDRSAPTVRSITGLNNTALSSFAPDTPIVVKFDEPVDINSVNIAVALNPNLTPKLPSGVATPTFTKAYGNGGADKSTVIFTPVTPLFRPTNGAPAEYGFKINGGVLDLFTPTAGGSCNGANKQDTTSTLNLGAEFFTVKVPVEATPPAVRSIVATREEITIQFSEAVISTINNDNGAQPFSKSARNKDNYYGTYKVAKVAAGPSTYVRMFVNPGNPLNQDVTTRGTVSYSYFDPNRTGTDNNNNIVSSPGYVTVVKAIKDIRYDATANAATLTLDSPMTEGQGTSQAETVYVSIPAQNQSGGVNDTITDLNTNAIGLQELSAPVQTGRADWTIQMAVNSDVPGASPDANNFFGVHGLSTNFDGSGNGDAASNGFDAPRSDGTQFDVPEPLAPGANHVFLFSSHGNNETGWVGNGGNYAQDIQSRPQLEENRTWSRIGVQTDLGATGAPAVITMSWNVALGGREVPATDSIELLNLNPRPGEPTSIDMRAQSSFSYTVENNGLDQARFFSLVVTAPGVQSAPFQLSDGFNMVSIPVTAQNPAAANVFFGLSPLVIYRYDPNTGYEIFPSTPTFTTVEPGRGYFVRPRAAGYQLKVLGVPVVGQTTVAIRKGWNLIGNPFNVPVNGANILIRTATGDISAADAIRQGLLQDAFFTFDSVTRNYTAPQSFATGTFQPWRGYWVLSFQDVTLVFNKPTQVSNP